MYWSYQLFPAKARISHINHVTSASTMITTTNNKNKHIRTLMICVKCIVVDRKPSFNAQQCVNEIFYAFVPNKKNTLLFANRPPLHPLTLSLSLFLFYFLLALTILNRYGASVQSIIIRFLIQEIWSYFSAHACKIQYFPSSTMSQS